MSKECSRYFSSFAIGSQNILIFSWGSILSTSLITIILWLAGVQVNCALVILHSFDPNFIDPFAADMIIAIIYQSFGYFAQLIFRLYIKYRMKNDESYELLSMITVIMLSIIYCLPFIAAGFMMSMQTTYCIVIHLNFTLLPGLILHHHHGARHHFVFNHPIIMKHIDKVKMFVSDSYVKIRDFVIALINSVYQFFVDVTPSNQVHPQPYNDIY